MVKSKLQICKTKSGFYLKVDILGGKKKKKGNFVTDNAKHQKFELATIKQHIKQAITCIKIKLRNILHKEYVSQY